METGLYVTQTFVDNWNSWAPHAGLNRLSISDTDAIEQLAYDYLDSVRTGSQHYNIDLEFASLCLMVLGEIESAV